MTLKRTMCALLAATMLIPSAVMAETAASAAEVAYEESEASVDIESSADSYGLASEIQNGNILHCLNWKLSDIKAEIPNIAKAGFTAVQTSPIQAHDSSGNWYWLYQPINFWPGSDLGTEADLKALCAEAENYGVKVVVDVVANHFAGNHSNIPDELKASTYYHNTGIGTSDGQRKPDWNNRWEVTHCDIGMPDLNSENELVQQYVRNYVDQLKADGVDGIRWDAAKHIALPSEGCNFWPAVTEGTGMYHYGEILDSPGGDGATVMKEYTKYMSVTDNQYSNNTRYAFQGGSVMSGYGQWSAQGVPATGIVYWAESHDTYYNGMESQEANTYVINKAYAAIACRNGSQALYMSRQGSNNNHGSAVYGIKGETAAAYSKEVAAVNHFRNAMGTKADYYSADNGCAVITRKDGGAVIVKGSGSGQVSVTNGGGYAKPGTYKDEISGNTFTVTSTTISGNIGDTGIAVIYDGTVTGGVSATPASGTTFTDTLTVTLSATDVSNAKYTTSEGASGSYTNGQTITIGSSTAEGGSVTLTLTGTKSDGTSASATYTYKKTAPVTYPTLNGGGFVFDNSTKNWSTVNAYVYDESGSSVVNNASWPGSKMTDCGNGYWKYELDSKFSGSSSVQVIFNNGSEQIPAAQQSGYTMSATDKKLYDGSWKDLPVSSTLKVSLSASATSVNTGTAVTLTATATGATGTVTYTFEDGSTQIQSSSSNTAKWTPSTAGTHTIKVTAKDSNGSASATTTVTVTASSTDPTVTVDKASGSSFTTETTDIKLTLANATKGTYSVDDGPTKEFTGSKTVTIGEGKIGDSTVTVKATATNAAGTTKTYTFTYDKKYVVMTSSSSSTPASSGAGTLASQYKTNPNGATGKQKTITIDGDASDWSEDMLIAQGAAWDVANHWKGGHENCVLDTYALYGAWDNDNLYIGWQMVNTTDTWAREGDGPLSDGGRVLDVPLILALSIDPSSTSMSNKNTSGTPIWGQRMGLQFDTHVDRLLYMSGKPGNGEPSMFSAVDANGNTNYTTGCVAFKDGGIEYKMATTNICSSIIGLNSSDDPSDVTSDAADWVDYKTFSGSAGTHKSTYDSFYEIKIPLATLGITKDYLTSNGIGAMLVATRGESALDCIPYDLSMVDNVTGDYYNDPSTSHEKDDEDVITSSFARIGAAGGDTPTPTPTPTPTTPLQVNFGADKSAPQLTTTALTLKGIGYGGTAPYKYEFSIDGSVVKASNTTATSTWTPTTEGQHTMKCVITDADGSTATVTKTFTAEATGDTPVPSITNNSKLSASSITKGSSVTITGAASGGTAPYTYSYYVKKSTSSSWTALYESTTSTSQSYTPAYTGTYEFKVDVKDSQGNTASKTMTLEVTAASTALTNSSSLSATSVVAGTKVTIKGAASGGTSPYKYSYYYKKSTESDYTLVGDVYGTATSASFTPSESGTYNVVVKVMDSTGTIVSKSLTLTVTGSTTTELANNSTISDTSVVKGTAVKVTAKATGGTAPYTYTYQYKRTTASDWTTLASKTSESTKQITFSYTGTYTVKAYVIDSTGKTVSKTFTVEVTAASTALTNSSTVSASSVVAGTAVTVTGKASGGTSPYKYTYQIKRASSSTWTTKASNTTSTTMSFTPGYAETYNVKVTVTDSKGTTATKTMDVAVTAASTALTNSSTVSASSVVAGTAVTVTGKASGGTSPYKYTYQIKRASSSTWTTKASNTTSTTMSFTPGYAETYNVKVTVTDSKGTTATKTMSVAVTAASTGLTNNSTISATSVVKGTTVKVTAKASSGTSPYKYTYQYKRTTASDWTTLASKTSDTSMTFTFNYTGTYTVKAYVIDSTGKTVSKTFTVEVTAK